MAVDTWKYLNLIQGGVILPNGWYTRHYSECDLSDYTRGSNTSQWLIYSAILGMWSVRLYEGIIEVELIYREGARPGFRASNSHLRIVSLADRAQPLFRTLVYLWSLIWSIPCSTAIVNTLDTKAWKQLEWRGEEKNWQGHFRSPDLGPMPSARCEQVTAEKAFLMGPVKVVFHLFWFLCPDIWYKETQRVMNMVPGHKTWWWGASRDVTKWPQDWLRPVNHWSIIEPGGVTQIWSKSSPHSKTLHTHQWKLLNLHW